jgi:hypothetical protein
MWSTIGFKIPILAIIFIAFSLSFKGWLPFVRNRKIIFVPENLEIETERAVG